MAFRLDWYEYFFNDKDEFDEENNQRLLKSLYNANADLEYPLEVRFGDRLKEEFSIKRRLNVGADSITYEAFRKSGNFLSTIPVIIKAYKRGVRKHPLPNFISDVNFLKKDSKWVTWDVHNMLVVFDSHGLQLDETNDLKADDENDRLVDGLIEPTWNELPYVIHLGPKKEDEYMVEKYVGRGKQGIVYEGYRTSDPLMNPVIIKSYLRNDNSENHFRNEEFALEKQSRLIHSDPNHMVLVQTKIEGDTLASKITSLISNDQFAECDVLLDRYLSVPKTLRDRFGLVHNDAHPHNIIVDSNGVFHLIDFGETVPLSNNKRKSAIQVFDDDKLVDVCIQVYKRIMSRRKDK